MNLSQIHSYEDRIEYLIKISKSELSEDLEMQAHFARYICVLVSGYLEVSVRTLTGFYASEKCDPKVTRYVQQNVNRFQNPKFSKIVDLVHKFDISWAEELDSICEGEIKDATNSIVSNRHLISHGQSSGVSLGQIEKWYRSVKELVKIIRNIFIPT